METVNLSKATIQALAQELGNQLLDPTIPLSYPSIKRGATTRPFGVAVSCALNLAIVQPIPTFIPKTSIRMFYTGYKAHASFRTGTAVSWLVEVKEEITTGSVAILATEAHLPPEAILELHKDMSEANKIVRTIGLADDDDAAAWVPLIGSAGLLDNGSDLALFTVCAQNVTGVVEGVLSCREYRSG